MMHHVIHVDDMMSCISNHLKIPLNSIMFLKLIEPGYVFVIFHVIRLHAIYEI